MQVHERGSAAVDVLIYLTVGLTLVCVFDILNAGWSPVGPAFYRLGLGAIDQIQQFRLPSLALAEYGLVIAILLLLYFPQVQTRWLRYLLPVVPVSMLFVFIDLFFQYLARIPRVGDLSTLADLYAVRWYYGCAAALMLVSPLVGIAVLLRLVYRDSDKRRFRSDVGGRLALAVGGVAMLLSPAGAGFEQSIVVMRWSELFTVQSNGRLASFVYYARRDRDNRRLLERFTDRADIGAALYPGEPAARRNVHMVVLESFVDPRLFEGVRYSRTPLADELKPFLHKRGGGFSHIVSPVYGGGTARACFEVLSGLPSLGLVEPIEFNLMRQGKVQAFPWQLVRNGYDTLATLAASSEYFNEPRAYAALAFDDVLFLGDPGSGAPLPPRGSEMFDGDLFDHALQRLEKRSASGDTRPLLTYTLGMYGHYPYSRDLKRQPDLVGDNSGIKDVSRIANQFYYRTRALGRYLAQLKALDPNAIVFVTADHIPVVLKAGIRYRLEKHVNSALLLDAWQPVDIGGRHQYEVAWLIWDRLRGEGGGKRPLTDEAMQRLYYTALRQGTDAPAAEGAVFADAPLEPAARPR